jgi:hypothetical protein
MKNSYQLIASGSLKLLTKQKTHLSPLVPKYDLHKPVSFFGLTSDASYQL